jgi:hypothetical protein
MASSSLNRRFTPVIAYRSLQAGRQTRYLSTGRAGTTGLGTPR